MIQAPDAPLLGRLLELPTKHWTRLNRYDRSEHSSLFQIFVNYGRKKFKTLTTSVTFTTLHFLRNY